MKHKKTFFGDFRDVRWRPRPVKPCFTPREIYTHGPSCAILGRFFQNFEPFTENVASWSCTVKGS